MRNWDALDERGECPGDRDWRDVQAICQQLDIPCRQASECILE
jgi:tRNA U34 2-thiouridine synthase MnmA/TrmU